MLTPKQLAAVVVVATAFAAVAWTLTPDTGWPPLTALLVWIVIAFAGVLVAVVVAGSPPEAVNQ